MSWTLWHFTGEWSCMVQIIKSSYLRKKITVVDFIWYFNVKWYCLQHDWFWELWILLITYNVCPALRSRSGWSITEELCCWYTLAPAWRGHALGSHHWPSLLILHKSPQSTNCQGQGVSLSRFCYDFIPLVMIMCNTQVNGVAVKFCNCVVFGSNNWCIALRLDLSQAVIAAGACCMFSPSLS